MELSTGRGGGCASRVERTPSESRDSLSFPQSHDSSRSLSSHSANIRAHKKKHDILAKIILLGDSTVGKSCLTNRYVMNDFDFNSIATVGMDIRIKNIDMDGKVVKLQIWDTAGQERYRGITKAFHRGANGVMFIYDITNRQSFQQLIKWIGDFEKSTTAIDHTPMIVVGNKADMEEMRAVEKSTAQQWCDLMRIPYMETSALTGEGVEEAFSAIAKDAALHASKRSEAKKKIDPRQRQRSKKCPSCIIS